MATLHTASVVESLPGVVSHHRSLLVWPALLECSSMAVLRFVAYTGARILSIGSPLPDEIAAGGRQDRLALWHWSREGTMPHEFGEVREPSRAAWREITELHQACKLTPLPDSARDCPAWRHTWEVDGRGHVLACASAQALPATVTGEGTALVACVAVRPSHRRRGLASARVAALLCDDAVRRGLAITESPAAASFFHALGWAPSGDVWLFRWD